MASVGCIGESSGEEDGASSAELAARKRPRSSGGTTTTGTTTTDAGTTASPTPTTTATSPTSESTSVAIAGLHVDGNLIRDAAGQVVRLHGVNRASAEYACIQGWGFFSGPTDDAAIASIASWNANAVRIPLNETCWLGINGAPAAYSGAAYKTAISAFVSRVLARGLTPILDLHWAAPGTQQATGQLPMANRDHSLQFWRELADAYKGDARVVFELYNEPYPDNNSNSAEAWRCWRDGGTCSGVSYAAAGVQELVDAVRGTGAKNLLLLGGVQYSNSLWSWTTYKPVDPVKNLAAAWHVYNYTWYTTTAEWDQMIGPVLADVPVVATEVGENTCNSAFTSSVTAWLDSHAQSYTAWWWNVSGQCYDLIADWSGTPKNAYGTAYHDHLLSIR